MKGFDVLLLTRKNQQAFSIGDDIVVTVVEIAGGRIKIGIDAPREVRVVRPGHRAANAPICTSVLRDESKL